ncbi:MAG: type II toxin-antitoxin system HipA family toxin, partial [Thiolinea sp.]
APAFDIVSTTPYIPNDSLALLFGGSKFFPQRKGLITFGRRFCGFTERRITQLLDWVVHGMESTLVELTRYRKRHKDFAEIGQRMEVVWREGIDDLRGHDS